MVRAFPHVVDVGLKVVCALASYFHLTLDHSSKKVQEGDAVAIGESVVADLFAQPTDQRNQTRCADNRSQKCLLPFPLFIS
jgi:hypothetical protein